MSIINVREELLDHVKGEEVEYVKIAIYNGYKKEPTRIEGTLEEVLPKLDINYDDGFGWQMLFGYIWYKDGSWSDRAEYDGSEWWDHQKLPSKDIVVSVKDDCF